MPLFSTFIPSIVDGLQVTTMAKSVQEFKIPIFFLLLVILPPMLSGWHAHPLVKGPVILAVPISFSEWPPGAHSVGIAWDGNSGWFVCHKKGLLKKKKRVCCSDEAWLPWQWP